MLAELIFAKDCHTLSLLQACNSPPLDVGSLAAGLQVTVGMASRGLRCIALTYTDYPAHDPSRPADFFEDADRVDHNLIAQAIVGIKDPVRSVAHHSLSHW